ncbi:hypothetical protein HID58_025051, partial [Brassica napus]
MRGSHVEEREEGELQRSEAKVGKGNQSDEIVQQDVPSLEFQEELAKTQATGAAFISDPMDTESGLQVVKSLIGNVTEVDDGADTDTIMDMDEIRAVFLEHGVDMDAADLVECSEGEMAEALRELEEASGEENREVEEVTNVEAEKDMADGDMGKKNGSRKRLFKPTISTAASTKMRLAKALVSPRKRAVGKTGMRHGESVSWYEVFSLVGFVYHRVHGSHGNKGLQYEVTCMDLCLIVTKALWFFQVALSDNLLYFIGFGLSYRNSTFILWPGVRKRADYLKKAGLQTTFGSSSGTNLLSWDEDTMWSVDMRGLLWCFGTVYWFGYWDEDFRINFWMQSLCWVSLNPTQRVLAMQKMGLRRQCRSRLMVSNTDTGGLTLSYAMGLWNK